MSQTEQRSPKEIIKETINELKEEGIFQGFPTGKSIPNFTLNDHNGEEVEIYDELDHDFLILNFFRGDWCGYCRKELEELKDKFSEISNLGAKIISLAPQSIDKLAGYKEELRLPFKIHSDPHLQIAKMFNLVWEIPENLQEIYLEEFNLNIPELNGNESWHLPVPATYIIQNNGSVLAKYENLNYSKRMNTGKIIEILENNQQ